MSEPKIYTTIYKLEREILILQTKQTTLKGEIVSTLDEPLNSYIL